MLEELIDLFEYNRWANDRILEVARGLSEEEVERDLGSSFPSIRATLAHMLSAEWIWLARWKGTSPTAPPADWDLSTVAAIESRWREIHGERAELLASLDDDSLKAGLTYRNLKGDVFTNPLWQLLRHVINHATYHRGQLTTMLRQVGATPTSTDLVNYYRESGSQS